MYVVKESSINWLDSMDRLSVGAFYLLNVMYRYDIDINDNSLMEKTGFGLSTHRKQKRELIENGYLTIDQIGKGVYEYKLGGKNGK